MYIRVATILLISFQTITVCRAQLSCRIQAGAGYIEHFSTGIKFGLGENELSLAYGSDFFINRNDFSTYLVGYERHLNRLQIKGFIPKLGVKGGYSVYTNKYYRWKLLVLIPYAGIEYPVGKRTDLAFDMGLAFSEERSLERISYGEIGTYRKYLPEYKLSILFNLCRN